MTRWVSPPFKPCEAVESDCHCASKVGHAGLHFCECGGSWEYIDGEFTPRSLPGTAKDGPEGDFFRDVDEMFRGLLR